MEKLNEKLFNVEAMLSRTADRLSGIGKSKQKPVATVKPEKPKGKPGSPGRPPLWYVEQQKVKKKAG